MRLVLLCIAAPILVGCGEDTASDKCQGEECDGIDSGVSVDAALPVNTCTETCDNSSALPCVTSVSGTFSSGESIRICGGNFGILGPANLFFDDFESGTTGTPIRTGSQSATVGGWASISGDTMYSPAASVSGSMAFQADMSAGYANYLQIDIPDDTQEIFVSEWLYLPVGDNAPGEGTTDGRNWKQLWVQGGSTTDDDLVVPTLHSSWQINGNDGVYADYVSVDFVKGEWTRIWFHIKVGYNNDGEVNFWNLGPSGTIGEVLSDQVTVLKPGGFFERVRVNGYGRTTANSHPTFDDVYVATGPGARARIELGDAPDYSLCSDLTLLTTEDWSPNQLTAALRPGRFVPGQQGYLFVFDALGRVNSVGYPIVVQ